MYLEKGEVNFNQFSHQSILLSSYCELIEATDTVVPERSRML